MKNKNLVKITSDCFNVVARLRAINSSYGVYYNKQFKRFELHNQKYFKNSFEMVLPFASLNAKAVKHVFKSLKTTSKQKFLQMEKHNARLEEKAENESKDESKIKLKEIYQYAQGGKEYRHEDAYLATWH